MPAIKISAGPLAEATKRLSELEIEHRLVHDLYGRTTHRFALRQPLLRSRKFAITDYFAGAGAMPNGRPHGWKSLGNDPKFFVALNLARGSVRIRLNLTIDGGARPSKPAKLQIYFNFGSGMSEKDSLVVPINADALAVDETVFLARPALQARIDPVDFPCDFTLELAEVTQYSRLHDFIKANSVRKLQSID